MASLVSLKIKSITRKPAEPVYDIQVKKNHNFFAKNLLVHNCVIFQEQVMELAEKVAGFPKDKCDEVRRAIMKRSISGGEAAKKAAEDTRTSFVEGCLKNGYTDKVANNLYDKILYFAGYGFNKSHAVAYAIDSYWCAWLMTYYEEQWICSYLESMSNTPDQRAKAFGEMRSLGYQIVPIDVNLATVGWTILPGKKLMPSMSTLKGVGGSAVDEIIAARPFASIEDMLYNEDGSWRLSKFNKRALEGLIKVRAFASFDCVGEDKIFKSYRHMHETLLGSYTENVPKRKGSEEMVERIRDHASLIKKSTKKDPYEGRKNFYTLARGLAEDYGEEWTQREMAEFQAQLFGSSDITMMFDQGLFDRLEAKGVKSIEEVEMGATEIVWFVTVLAAPKKGSEPASGVKRRTKNGKEYIQAFVTGPIGKPIRLSVWGRKDLWDAFNLCVAEVRRDDFGFSTAGFKVKIIA